jgi:hypothetical protein
MADDRPYSREVADRQVTMFAMFVGQGRHTTFAALAVASKYPQSTLRDYANGSAMPIAAVLALSKHLPRAAINMLTEPGGLQLVDIERDTTNWDTLAASTSALTFEICDARSDGNIDHREEARLRQHARDLAAKLNEAAEERL